MRARIRQLEKASNTKSIQHVRHFHDHIEIFCLDENGKPAYRKYYPNQTGKAFHEDDSFIRLTMGPYGSGKTTMSLQDIVIRACQMPVWSNGRRKSRGIVIRNTSGELTSTTLQSWLAWFSYLGDISKRQKPILTYEHIFRDDYGTVELELIFLALDRPDDVRKLKSLEATFAYLNELSELPQNILSHIKGRVNGRYPSKSFCQDNYWSGIIADTNPPDEDHWIHNDFEIKKLESYRIFKQPPGLIKDSDGNWIENPYRDNSDFLVDDYYTKLAEGQTQDFVKVFCLGQYGSVGTGKVVYPEYNDDIHSVDEIKAMQGIPIDLSWDFGLTPACLVTQITPRGQLLVLKEYCAKDMGIRTFAESVVLPSLVTDFPYNKIGSSVADPAGAQRNQVFEELSCIGEICSLGINTVAARTNDLEPRLAAGRYMLNKLIDGKPAVIISRKGAPVLRKGFIKDYVFKRLAVSGEERYKNEPDKNHASHPHDCYQYRSLEVAAIQIVQSKQDDSKEEDLFNPTFRFL